MLPFNADRFRRAGFTLIELIIAMSLLAVLSTAVISAYLFMGRNLERLGKNQQMDVKARRALFQFTQDVGSAISFTSTTSANLTVTVPTTLTIALCTTTSGSKNVTCPSTAGIVTGMSVACLPAVPATATVGSISNGTTFVLSVPAATSSSGLTVNFTGTPTAVSYLYNTTANASTTPVTPAYSLTRKVGTGSAITILLTDIDPGTSNPANGFAYYNQSGTALSTTPNPNPSVSSVEFAFTTKSGNLKIGTQSTYLVVSPRIIARNKQFLP